MYSGTFTPPSPGAWELETTHMTRPLSRWIAHQLPPAFIRGFQAGTAHYGMLLDYLEMRVVDGFAYGCMRPVGAPKTAKGPPPKPVMWLLTRLHPELRRRNKRAREVFENKLWRDDVARWDGEWLPRITADNAKLAAVEPSALSTAALVAHLDDISARVDDAAYWHHRMTPCNIVPTGEYLHHAKEWTGNGSRELLALLRGSSPVSCGAATELARLATAVRGQPKLLDGDATDVLARLRAASGELGAATRAYLDAAGLRILSYDVGDPYVLEMPELLVGAIRSAVATSQRAETGSLAEDTARVRDAVPAQHRERFDELLGEARLVYRIRDERGYCNDAPACGIARRGLLAAGDRLVAAGKLEAREHAVELTSEEVRALLRGEPGPSAAETAAYFEYRKTKTCADAPARIGFAPSPPPDPGILPAASARMMRAVGVMISEMFEVCEPKAAKTVHGLPASPGKYEGRARVVLSADQFARVERGDVLIARTTSPTYNVLLPLLGGIVTDRGGMLSHAAIVAREYGMPAVVGTSNATSVVPDGARVRLDGVTGEVQVLS
jgi:rifampicin phosphotransferase